MKYFYYIFVGVIFGILLIKSEVISWFRIQEMFHFHSFHMYGVIGSAVVTGIISVQLLKVFGAKKKIVFNLSPKPTLLKAQLFGGIIFGVGWALTGACPGPLYALIGFGNTVILVSVIFAILGTIVYGLIKKHLPH